MAKALIDGIEHEVVSTPIIEKNYGVSVLANRTATRATTNLGARRPVLHRYKIHADNAEAAIRRALADMKSEGLIDDYQLEPHEEAPPPPEPKKKPAPKKPAPKPAAADAPAPKPAAADAPAPKPAAADAPAPKPAAADAPAPKPAAPEAPPPLPTAASASAPKPAPSGAAPVRAEPDDDADGGDA